MKTLLVDAVDTFVIEGKRIYQPLYDLLEKYPNPKIILTNANKEEFVTFGLTHLPYPIFTLKHNPNKTDPFYFQTFLSQNNLKANDVIYFEHNPQAVESAKSLGITSHYYDADKKDLDSLKQFLDQNLQ